MIKRPVLQWAAQLEMGEHFTVAIRFELRKPADL
jgi:hypothetical protein